MSNGDRAFRPLTFRQWIGWIGIVLVALITIAVGVWHGDILRAGLDPRVPFLTYDPPRAPNYTQASSWALRETRGRMTRQAPVFFVYPTAFDGGRDWNAPIDDQKTNAFLSRVILPNYAAPFARAGAMSVPRYRQGSLYTRLSLRRDSREARAFAYEDVEAAFDEWLSDHPDGPLVLAGVEQGAELLSRLIQDRVTSDGRLSRRIVAVYMIEALVAVDDLPASLPPCRDAQSFSCAVGWLSVSEGDEPTAARAKRRALIWDPRGRLISLEGRRPLCVNPVTGMMDEVASLPHQHRGATNATGLEWGARPALIARMMTAQCRAGILWTSPITLESFRSSGSWADQRKILPYSMFYADIEADVQNRTVAWAAAGSRG